ncbi:hypothetical protein GEV02_20520 [Rugamonas sp. FT29W]|uniref:Uncharacterized protein n=2 Tax=Rugamonas aquatica TaxID=2743357 RepID=A0A6A7N6P1_9BURK|nr:hypothetical protein [Rugamonas aquatica]
MTVQRQIMQIHLPEYKQLKQPDAHGMVALAPPPPSPLAMSGRMAVALALFFSVYALGWLGEGLRERQLALLREQRFDAVLGQLRVRLQAQLSPGRPLVANPQAQALLEEGAARVPELLALEVVSTRGLSLFSSDRGLRGQTIPPAWLDAMTRAPGGWQVTRQDERSAGVPLDCGGGAPGFLVLTYRVGGDPGDNAYGLAVGMAAAALALLQSGWRARRRRAAQRDELARLDLAAPTVSVFGAAARELVVARLALAELDQQGRRLGDGGP